MSAEKDVRIKKAESLRYKKAMVNNLSFWQFRNSLEEMSQDCEEVSYWSGSDLDTLVDALDGDLDEAQQFQFDFAQLSSDIERMWEDMNDIDEPESFDDILVVSGMGSKPGYEILGYDVVEEDYFGIDAWMRGYAVEKSAKRLERLTKKHLIERMAQVICITFAYQGILSRYQDLKAAMDILKARNKEYLDGVKAINEIYDSQDWSEWDAGYSKAAEQINEIAMRLPQEAWL